MKKTEPVSLDLNDGIAVRTYLESLRGSMRSTRGQYDSKFGQLRAFFAPLNGRWDPADVNNGARQDFCIINETGQLSLRTLKSGMLNGMSNQTKKWFGIVPNDPAYKDDQEAKVWCEKIAEEVRATMLKSNYYQALLELYGDEGQYGTGAFLIEADPETDIRCHPYPMGSYYIGTNDQLRVDLSCRELSFTPRSLCDKFGYDEISSAMQVLVDSNAGGVQEQQVYPIAHFILPSSYFKNAKPYKGVQGFKWYSIWYEIGNYKSGVHKDPDCGLLRFSGFMENPLVCGRWETTGENIYGNGPAEVVLGSTMSLQAWEERIAQGGEKYINPPMVAGTDVDPRRLTTLPGEFTFVDSKDTKGAFGPAYQIDFKLEGPLKLVERIEARIKDGLFVSVFQLFSDSDRREMTAEEVRARSQEKLQILGPVIERNTDEVHAPSINRILGILQRIPGRLPKPPASMCDPDGTLKVGLKVQFESMLVAAAKMSELNNISTVIQFVTSEQALNTGMVDNIDLDKVTRRVADLAALPSDLLNSEEKVAQIRADKQEQARRQQAAENAQGVAQAAKVASETPIGGGTLLDKVAPGIAGGGVLG